MVKGNGIFIYGCGGKRTYYSFKKGYVTLRIPNKLIQNNAYETAKYISQFLESIEDQLEDELNDEEDF